MPMEVHKSFIKKYILYLKGTMATNIQYLYLVIYPLSSSGLTHGKKNVSKTMGMLRVDQAFASQEPHLVAVYRIASYHCRLQDHTNQKGGEMKEYTCSVEKNHRKE